MLTHSPTDRFNDYEMIKYFNQSNSSQNSAFEFRRAAFEIFNLISLNRRLLLNISHSYLCQQKIAYIDLFQFK